MKVASDLFSYGGTDYLITANYHSNSFETDLLINTSSEAVTQKLKAHFTRNRAPDQLIMDKAPVTRARTPVTLDYCTKMKTFGVHT